MKKTYPKAIVLFFILLATAFISSSMIACSSSDSEPGKPTDPEESKPDPKPSYNIPTAEGISDLALIYHGYKNRAKWTKDDLKPFLYRTTKDNKPEWLFDGFLFLEIYATLNGVEYNLGVELPWNDTPHKAVWEQLLDVNFAEGRGVKAAEAVLDSLAQKGYPAPYKRQVVFAIPNPIYNKKNWGIINSKVMDFSKVEDRIEAAIWYVDQIEDRWKKSNFEHLNLDGFYWLHETIDYDHKDNEVILAVQKELHKRGYNLTWIPYNWADGTDENWKKLGFDVAYQQPNYYFKRNDGTFPEKWVLTRAIEHAKSIGMYMEIEFGEEMNDDLIYLSKLHEYIEEFEKGGVWANSPVAFYHGSNAWGLIANSKRAEYQEVHKILEDLLAKRHGKFVKIQGAK